MGIFDFIGIDYRDHLKDLPPPQVAAFYTRLAQKIESVVGLGNSLASVLLLHWLNGKGAEKTFESRFVTSLPQVGGYLKDKVRPVLLTERKVQFKSAGREFWGGIVPRIKKVVAKEQPDPRDGAGNFPMMYEGPSIEPIDQSKFALIMKKYKDTKDINELEKRELDVFTSLHTFGIQTNVVVSARPVAQEVTVNSKNQVRLSEYLIKFQSWKSHVRDRYDWNVKLGFPVPNPDFGSTAPGAVAPKEDVVVVYHENAKRLEDAGLAQTFDVKSTEWDVTDSSIVGDAKVDIAKALGGEFEWPCPASPARPEAHSCGQVSS
jgi:hypothetical protein